MGGRRPWNYAPSSGNRAFDEYRTDTLRRLEEEQREFRDFLDRLRFAKDKTEFDQFMAERREPARAGRKPAPELNATARLQKAARMGGLCISACGRSRQVTDSLTIISAV